MGEAGEARGPDLPQGVTVEVLRVAVATSRSWRGVLRHVGLTSPRQGRRMQQACDELGIPYSHFRHHKAGDAALARVVARSRSWTEVLVGLGHAPDSGSARASLRLRCQRLGVEVGHLGAAPSPDPEGRLRTGPQARHLRDAGSLLVAASCTLAGHRVSWPLEPAVYDLLIDTGPGGIRRVQVKTTTTWVAGAWLCTLTRSEYAGAAGGKRPVRYSSDQVDDFGIVDGDQEVYLIPFAAVAGRTAVSLRRYAAFRVPRLAADRRSGQGPAATAV